MLRTGPCSVRRNRQNLGTSPLAGPAYRRVVAQEQKAFSRETFLEYLNVAARASRGCPVEPKYDCSPEPALIIIELRRRYFSGVYAFAMADRGD